MRKIISSKFIEHESYWFNVEQDGDSSYIIVNTKLKRNQTERDGLPVDIETFYSLKEANKYLDNIGK